MSAFFGYINFDNIEYPKNIIKNIYEEIRIRPGIIQEVCLDNSFHLNVDDAGLKKNIYIENNFLINFNGRVDNKDELDFYDLNKSSAENILNAFLKNKEDQYKNISGPFAFVIFDIKKKLVVAYRDHMGIRPFYYFYDKRKFIYSTEPEFIFVDKQITKEININKLKYFIVKGNRFNNETFYKDIFKLRRSSRINICNKTINVNKYYEFFNKQEDVEKDDEYYSLRFQELFLKIIKQQSDVGSSSISTMLSGGLDTSSITSALSYLKNFNSTKEKQFNTYSITFNQLKKEDIKKVYETNYINDVVKKYNLNSIQIDLKATNIQKELGDMQDRYPEPNYHGNKYMDIAIIKAMQKNKDRYILSGFDGDSVVSHGHQRIFQLLEMKSYKSFYNEVKNLDNYRGVKSNILKKYIVPYYIPNFIYKIYANYKENFPATQTSKFLKESVIKDIPIKEMNDNYLRSKHDYSNFHLNTINTNVWEHVFEIQDIDYGRAGIEIRYPFMDRRLIELCLALPESQKLKNGVSRYILRESMKDILPNSIYTRMSKSILSPYYDYSFENYYDEMKKSIIEPNHGYFDDLLNIDFINNLDKKTIKPNEAIIFQHIYILSKWLDFK